MRLLNNWATEVGEIIHNGSPAFLIERALAREGSSALSATGALIAMSGDKTGRSPGDKRLVEEPTTRDDIWWGPVNRPASPEVFASHRARALEYLNTRQSLYVVDGFAGWDSELRIKIRVVCARAYHALFMHNMLIRPSREELEDFGEPDFSIINAGACAADSTLEGMSSETSVCLSFSERELVILGTEYAGEMKKGVFTIMNELMPRRGHLPMHCSATEGRDGTTSILFGLSGTGKTTLSADPKRRLIGDDEHVWSERGVSNIEGGCYAKVIHLSAASEPEIFRAIRFGAVLENVVFDPSSRSVDFDDTTVTENTRASYPIEHMPSAKVPCLGAQPRDVIFLTCDAFGVLPPVAQLTEEQAMYHFISGYTAKVAGTEMGVVEPQATFSPCFGGPFLVWHPGRYAELLAEKLRATGARTWLVNTGWTGGAYGIGQRMDLSVTRSIIDAIHEGALARGEFRTDASFGFRVPTSCPGVESRLLDPRTTWKEPHAFDQTRDRLVRLFRENFSQYAGGVSREVSEAGPRCLPAGELSSAPRRARRSTLPPAAGPLRRRERTSERPPLSAGGSALRRGPAVRPR